MRGVRPEQVFDVLRDGQSYASSVDPGWPQPGSKLHFTIGRGPLRKDDETESLSCAPDTRLELEARAFPAGTARIVISVAPVAGGTSVSIDEVPERGPAKVLHNPIADLLVKLRNVETLRRLEKQAAGR
jgi:hypothetical protein